MEPSTNTGKSSSTPFIIREYIGGKIGFAVIFLLLIIGSIYMYPVNPILFGGAIGVFGCFLFLIPIEKISVHGDRIEYHRKRIIPFLSKKETAYFEDIDEVILPEEEKFGAGHAFKILLTLFTSVAGMWLLIRAEERLFIRMRDGGIKEFQIMVSTDSFNRVIDHLKYNGIQIRKMESGE